MIITFDTSSDTLAANGSRPEKTGPRDPDMLVRHKIRFPNSVILSSNGMKNKKTQAHCRPSSLVLFRKATLLTLLRVDQ